MTNDTLLVEGKSDQLLFKYLFSHHTSFDNVEISPPKLLGSNSDGIEGILDILPDLLKFKEFGGKLGIVLDADYGPSKGFVNRRNRVIEIVKQYGYYVNTSTEIQLLQGELFVHDELSSPVGLWIMPDHQSDGIFERLLLDTITDDGRLQLLNHIRNSLESIFNIEHFRDIRLKEVHKDKSLLNTWLYWQKQPNSCKSDNISIIECALSNCWLNPKHEKIQALTRWLFEVFK